MNRDAPAVEGFMAGEVGRAAVVDLSEVLRAGAAEARYPRYPSSEPRFSLLRVPCLVIRVTVQIAPQPTQKLLPSFRLLVEGRALELLGCVYDAVAAGADSKAGRLRGDWQLAAAARAADHNHSTPPIQRTEPEVTMPPAKKIVLGFVSHHGAAANSGGLDGACRVSIR